MWVGSGFVWYNNYILVLTMYLYYIILCTLMLNKIHKYITLYYIVITVNRYWITPCNIFNYFDHPTLTYHWLNLLNLNFVLNYVLMVYIQWIEKHYRFIGERHQVILKALIIYRHTASAILLDKYYNGEA